VGLATANTATRRIQMPEIEKVRTRRSHQSKVAEPVAMSSTVPAPTAPMRIAHDRGPTMRIH